MVWLCWPHWPLYQIFLYIPWSKVVSFICGAMYTRSWRAVKWFILQQKPTQRPVIIKVRFWFENKKQESWNWFRVLQMNESMTIVMQRCLQIKTLHERHTCINRQLMMANALESNSFTISVGKFFSISHPFAAQVRFNSNLQLEQVLLLLFIIIILVHCSVVVSCWLTQL